MKLTRQTTRALRRREIITRLLALADELVTPTPATNIDNLVKEHTALLLELHELCVAADQGIPRRRK